MGIPRVFDTTGRIHLARALLQNLTTRIVGIPTSILPIKAGTVSWGVNILGTASWWNWWYVCWIPETCSTPFWATYERWRYKRESSGKITTESGQILCMNFLEPMQQRIADKKPNSSALIFRYHRFILTMLERDNFPVLISWFFFSPHQLARSLYINTSLQNELILSIYHFLL